MTSSNAPDAEEPGLDSISSRFTADLVWTGHFFESGVHVAVGADGRIVSVDRSADAAGADEEPLERNLRRRAILPGFVNAHSHSFQRGLRGRGETFPASAGSFWSWREAMYELVGAMDEGRVYRLAYRAFREMLEAGMTTVGEFHYLHHEGSDDFTYDEIVLRAARDAGIRIVLLQTLYQTGAIGRPLQGAQGRFGCASLELYWRQLDRLAEMLDPETQSLGVVAHSIRAVPLESLDALAAGARERGLVMHMHVEEQRQEIESSLEVYGKTPMAVLNERGIVSDRLTSVHCTHSAPEDMERYLAAGGRVCICPLTEANLGDGLADVPSILKGGGPEKISLGSDSNARISMLEEMRWLEYGQRLRREERGACRDSGGRVARGLLTTATRGGAESLGIDAGEICPGKHADFVAIDLDSPLLDGADVENLAEALIFGVDERVIAEVCVGGRWVVGEAG